MDRFKQLVIKLATRNGAVFITLFAAGLIAYLPSLEGKFLFDDLYLVGQNPFFKSPIFLIEVFRHYLYLDSFSIYYRPVQNISYMFDYWLWFNNPFGYHLSNICYHALAAFLLFLLLKKVLPTLVSAPELGGEIEPEKSIALTAFLVSLVWVVHPIHNAAVAYVAGRADTLACILAIFAWLLYLRAAGSPSSPIKWALWVGAWLFILLGLCAKEIAVIWMGLFAFHLFVFDGVKPLRQKMGALVAIGLALGCYLFLRHLCGHRTPAGGGGAHPFVAPFLLMLRALGDYTGLIFYPANLHMDRVLYSINAFKNTAGWEQAIRYEYLSVLGALTLAAFGFMAWNKRPGQRLRIFSIAWFFIGFLPISNLFPLNAQVAEHWIYMPSMGFLLFLAGCALAMPEKFHLPAAGIALIAVIPFVMRTSARSYEWADSGRFYTQTIMAGGGTARIHLNLALVYSGSGDLVMAEKILRDLVRRFPDYAPARINLGDILRQQGKNKEAGQYLDYDRATADRMAKEYVRTWSARLNLAQMRCVDKQPQEALRILSEAITSFPDIWELRQQQAKILMEQNGADAAIPGVEQFARSKWWHYQSHLMLGRLRALNNEQDAALAALRHAALLDIHAGEPFSVMARMLYAQKKTDEARVAQMEAIRRDPNQPSQYLFLANILEQLNRKPEADAALRKAESLRDDAMQDRKKGVIFPTPLEWKLQ